MMTKNFIHGMSRAYDERMPILSMLVAASLTVPSVRIALAFSPRGAMPPLVERAAVAEAAAIWAPYGVSIAAVDPAGRGTDATVLLTVIVSLSSVSPQAPWQVPLGAVEFAANGTPRPVIRLFVDRVIRLLEGAQQTGAPPAAWPPLMRAQVVGRAIGRVLAHEIGHVVLRSQEHARSGLMRGVQRSDELVEPSRHQYRLRD